MSASFALDLLEGLLGHIPLSLGILYVLPILVNRTRVHLSFYIFDIMEFDLLIGQPIERLIQEGQIGKLKISLEKNFKLSIPITHSLNTGSEPIPEEDPMGEIKVASLESLIEPNLEDDAQFLIEEEDENSMESEPLDELLEPPMASIELKPLPSSLRYAFSQK